MISDGVENVLTYLDNFDPKKTQNPFAYFTQTIYFAFLRRIQKESKQQYVKYKSIQNSPQFMENYFSDEDFTGSPQDTYENINDFIRRFEKSLAEKKTKKRKKLDKKRKK